MTIRHTIARARPAGRVRNRLKIHYKDLDIEFRGLIWAVTLILMLVIWRFPEAIEAIAVLIETLKSVGP